MALKWRLVKLMPNILKPQTAYVIEYPEFAELADQQLDVFWPWSEIDVEKDKQALLTEMSEAEYHGIVTSLKLFTLYEIHVGRDYWSGKVMKKFNRPEIQRMAAAFCHVELNSHAPFYNQINRELGLDTLEFYNSYVDDPVLVERMDFIDSLVSDKDLILSLGGFSMVEGAILYSSFAFLKHFQANGKNKMMNVCRGINMSVIDENLHSVGGALLTKTLMQESNLTEEQWLEYQDKFYELSEKIRDHEFRIISMVFDKGRMENITETQMQHFVESRLNACLQQLGFKKLYDVKYNPIADWFYKGINDYQFNDFFSGIGREYQRNWVQTDFTWRQGE